MQWLPPLCLSGQFCQVQPGIARLQTAQAAIEAPRVRLPETSPGEPAAGWLEIVAEARLPDATQAELTRRGHQLDMQPEW